MPSLPVLALMVILPLLLIVAMVLVHHIYYTNISHYGRRKLVAVPSHLRMPAKPEWVRQEIIKLKAQGPDLGCRHIAMIFNRRYAAKGMTVGKTFVSTVIRKHRYDIQVIRQKLKCRKLMAGPRTASGAWISPARPMTRDSCILFSAYWIMVREPISPSQRLRTNRRRPCSMR